MTKRTKIVAAIAVAFCTLSASVAFAANSETVNGNVASSVALSGASLDQAAIDALRSEVDPSVFFASDSLNQIQDSYENSLVAIDMLNQVSIDQIMAIAQALSNKTDIEQGGLAGLLLPVDQASNDDIKTSVMKIDTSKDGIAGASLLRVRGTAVYMPVPSKNLGSYKMVPVIVDAPFVGSVLNSSVTLSGDLVKQASAQSGNGAVSIDTPILSQISVGSSRVTSGSSQPNPVPEPFTMALPLAGMAILRTLRKRNK